MAGVGSKALWSAASLGADLYLGSPMGPFTAAKLAEGEAASKAKAIVGELVTRAAFPDVRGHVNQGRLGVTGVLDLRAEGERFRDWLRSESELERDVLAAYLGEFAERAGWRTDLGKVIRVAGAVGGAVVGATTVGPLGAAGAAVAGAGLAYVADLASRIDDGWTPRVFGQATRAEIDRHNQ